MLKPHPTLCPKWCRSSCKHYKDKEKINSWIKTFCKGFGLLLTYEIIEELIEEAIAYTITTVIAKTLSFLLVVVLTQTVKVTAKGLAKGITVVLKPAVKKLTYKEGNDKINKILRFIDMCKEKIKENKFLNFLKRNPKTILGMVSGLIASVATGGATTCGLLVGHVELPLWANICIGIIICVVLFIANVFGVKGAGFENAKQYEGRKIAEKVGFDKVYDAILKAEQDFEAEEEAAKQAEAEKEEREKAQAEAEMIKYESEWRAGMLNGSVSVDVSLEAYVAEKQKEEAEKAAKIEKAKEEQEFRVAISNGYKGNFQAWKAEQNK